MIRLETSNIYAPVADRLARVEERLKSLVNVEFPFLSELLGHVHESSGKRVRPAITLLASGFHPHDGAKVEVMAAAVELLHVATLIHDDTVDASDFRRGKATISSVWGRNIALLLGDYIFASSATFVCDTEHVGVIRRFSETIMELSSGELRELAEAFDPNQTVDGYYRRIYEKTASLFATAGESGAILSGAPDSHVRALKTYSQELGTAFQIVDDILDFQGTPEEIGKPVGSDLANGILTLPALIAMQKYPMDNPIPRFFTDQGNMGLLSNAVDMVQHPEIINAAFSVAEDRCDASREALLSLPKNPSRDSLEELQSYVMQRRE